GGTIVVDGDANGVGWFIDLSPAGHDEFARSLAGTSYQALAGSEAVGRFDLFTVLLHETGHLAGFMGGYEGFDRHVQTLAGSQLFVGLDFTAALSADGEHLDSNQYPYDLMNAALSPSVREL